VLDAVAGVRSDLLDGRNGEHGGDGGDAVHCDAAALGACGPDARNQPAH
jgi:hypothetical protein